MPLSFSGFNQRPGLTRVARKPRIGKLIHTPHLVFFPNITLTLFTRRSVSIKNNCACVCAFNTDSERWSGLTLMYPYRNRLFNLWFNFLSSTRAQLTLLTRWNSGKKNEQHKGKCCSYSWRGDRWGERRDGGEQSGSEQVSKEEEKKAHDKKWLRFNQRFLSDDLFLIGCWGTRVGTVCWGETELSGSSGGVSTRYTSLGVLVTHSTLISLPLSNIYQ